MSKDLKKRGFNFVGSTICYAFMQATGMVNDHNVKCSATPRLTKVASIKRLQTPRPDALVRAGERSSPGFENKTAELCPAGRVGAPATWFPAHFYLYDNVKYIIDDVI